MHKMSVLERILQMCGYCRTVLRKVQEKKKKISTLVEVSFFSVPIEHTLHIRAIICGTTSSVNFEACIFIKYQNIPMKEILTMV